VTLTVVPERAEFSLQAGDPRSIADPKYRFLLRYQPNPNYSDTVTVAVSGQTFLKSVASKTRDDSKRVILNFVKAVSAIGPSFEAGEAASAAQVLAELTFDPLDDGERDEAIKTLNLAAEKFIDSYLGSNCDRESAIASNAAIRLPINELRQSAACVKYLELQSFMRDADKGYAADDYGLISIRQAGIPRPVTASKSAVKLPSVDCSVGVCYRPRLPYEFGFRIGKRGYKRTLMLPNRSALVAIDITRAFFVEKLQTIEFDEHGFLKGITVDKPSELQAVSLLPVEIIQEVTAALRIRVNVLERQIEEATATKNLIEAKAELEKQRRAFETYARVAGQGAGTASLRADMPGLSAEPALQTQSSQPTRTYLDGKNPQF
jgi:hypothetical protein